MYRLVGTIMVALITLFLAIGALLKWKDSKVQTKSDLLSKKVIKPIKYTFNTSQKAKKIELPDDFSIESFKTDEFYDDAFVDYNYKFNSYEETMNPGDPSKKFTEKFVHYPHLQYRNRLLKQSVEGKPIFVVKPKFKMIKNVDEQPWIPVKVLYGWVIVQNPFYEEWGHYRGAAEWWRLSLFYKKIKDYIELLDKSLLRMYNRIPWDMFYISKAANTMTAVTKDNLRYVMQQVIEHNAGHLEVTKLEKDTYN